MNDDTALFILSEHAIAVRASYEPARPGISDTLELFKTLDDTIAVDDLCVVPSSTRHGFTTVKVAEVGFDIDLDTTEPVKWIVCRVNLATYRENAGKEADAISKINAWQRRRELAKVRAEMLADDQVVKELRQIGFNGDSASGPDNPDVPSPAPPSMRARRDPDPL